MNWAKKGYVVGAAEDLEKWCSKRDQLSWNKIAFAFLCGSAFHFCKFVMLEGEPAMGVAECMPISYMYNIIT
jgi:glucose uptake protein GlcU